MGAWQGYDVEQCEKLTTNPYENNDKSPPVSPIKTTPQERYEGKTYRLESDVDLSLDNRSLVNEEGMWIFRFRMLELA